MNRKSWMAAAGAAGVTAGGLLALHRLRSRRALTSVDAERRIARSFVEEAKKPSVRNAVLLVDAPRLGVHVSLAEGVAHASDGSPMTAETPFLAASVGKLFTAATVLGLVRDGMLWLDEPVVAYLGAERMRALPTPEPEAITVRHLLMHRSGLPDYFEGRSRDGAPNLLELLRTEPDRKWTVDALLEYTSRHFAAVGAPGDVFHYADTNYDLLGLVIASATGEPFHVAVRRHVLDPLKLDRTWYYNLEPGPAPVGDALRYADLFLGDASVAGAPALSLDGAGGGVASTTSDLARFVRGLVDGRPVALDRFQESWTYGALGRGIDYGLGLWRITPRRVFPLLRGGEILGASGATGSFLYWAPAYDAVLSGTFDQTRQQRAHVGFLLRVLGVLDRVEARNEVEREVEREAVRTPR